MKKLFLSSAMFFILTSFVSNSQLVRSQSHSRANLFGPWFTLTSPNTANNGGTGSFYFFNLAFDYGGGNVTQINPNLSTGDPDQQYQVSAGSITISVSVYVDWDEEDNYVGIKDYMGNVLQSQLLIYGTHTYTFTTYSYTAASYTIYTT